MMSYASSDFILIQFTQLYLLGVFNEKGKFIGVSHLVPMSEAVFSLKTIFLSVHTHYHSSTMDVTIIGREI